MRNVDLKGCSNSACGEEGPGMRQRLGGRRLHLVTVGLWGRKGVNPAMVSGSSDWIGDNAIHSVNIYRVPA